MEYTAPFYAGVAYSVAAWLGRRTELNRRVADKWERGNVPDLGIRRRKRQLAIAQACAVSSSS